MILMQCEDVDRVVENGKQCIVISGKIVRPTRTPNGDLGEIRFEPVLFDGTDCISDLGQKLSLVPYPHGTSPSLITDDRRIFGVYGGALHLYCLVYDLQFDTSELIGNIYIIEAA